jgi:hypothetical protein
MVQCPKCLQEGIPYVKAAADCGHCIHHCIGCTNSRHIACLPRRQLRIQKARARLGFYQDCGDEDNDEVKKCDKCIEHGYYCPGKNIYHHPGEYVPED